MNRALLVKINPYFLLPNTYIAYIYKGKLCVGITETGLDPSTSEKFTVRNCRTGKIEYPYTKDVIIPNSEVKEVYSKLQTKDII